jgi:hypothetical protein
MPMRPRRLEPWEEPETIARQAITDQASLDYISPATLLSMANALAANAVVPSDRDIWIHKLRRAAQRMEELERLAGHRPDSGS